MPHNDAEKVWSEKASRLLKAELKRSGKTYDELAEKLGEMGLEETKASIANKLARGTFSTAFLLATLRAIGRETITISDM